MAPRVVTLEAWDNGILATLFGSASIQSSLAVGRTGNTRAGTVRPQQYWSRGFQFYDTWTQTILRDVAFREFHADSQHGALRDQDACALVSMTHSDEYTPQGMNATAGLHFVNVDAAQRLCVGNGGTGTLSSRNFNVVDEDGSLTASPGDGQRHLVGSGYVDTWKLSSECVLQSTWPAWTCPLHGAQNVASIGVIPDDDVHVTMVGLDNTLLGETYYSSANYTDAQIAGASGVAWHHAFPGGVVPPTFDVQTLQVPAGSFVVLTFSLPRRSSRLRARRTPRRRTRASCVFRRRTTVHSALPVSRSRTSRPRGRRPRGSKSRPAAPLRILRVRTWRRSSHGSREIVAFCIGRSVR